MVSTKITFSHEYIPQGVWAYFRQQKVYLPFLEHMISIMILTFIKRANGSYLVEMIKMIQLACNSWVLYTMPRRKGRLTPPKITGVQKELNTSFHFPFQLRWFKAYLGCDPRRSFLFIILLSFLSPSSSPNICGLFCPSILTLEPLFVLKVIKLLYVDPASVLLGQQQGLSLWIGVARKRQRKQKMVIHGKHVGASLACQWLGPWASTAGGTGLIPGWGTNPTSPAAWPKEKKKTTGKKTGKHAAQGSCSTVVPASTDCTISRALLLGVVLLTCTIFVPTHWPTILFISPLPSPHDITDLLI